MTGTSSRTTRARRAATGSGAGRSGPTPPPYRNTPGRTAPGTRRSSASRVSE